MNNWEFDKQFLNDEFKIIGGCDEAGRGPLAGPLVVACAIMPLEEDKIIENIDDSKKISEKNREILYEKIIQTAICYSVAIVDEQTIDEINILQATRQGMEKCINSMNIRPDLVLIDAVDKLKLNTNSRSFIKGDLKSYNIASASIIAKVTRDRIMRNLSKKYPIYEFDKHKGYGTSKHIELLKKYGKCDIHRNSFIKHFVD